MRKGKRFFVVSLCMIAIVGIVLFSPGVARAEEQKQANYAKTETEKRHFNLFSYFNIFKRSDKVAEEKKEDIKVVAVVGKQNIEEQKVAGIEEGKVKVAEAKKKKKKNKKTKAKKKGKTEKQKKVEKVKEEKKVAVEKKPAQVVDKIDPTDPNSIIYLGEKGGRRSTGDITKSGYASEAMQLGAGWHPKAIDAKQIPRDKFGLVNWVELVNKKAIEPKASLDPDYKEPQPFNMNILFKMKGGFVDNVVFPHDTHTYWLDCVNCHNKIFFQFAGWNDVKMTEIAQGEWCGRCHGRVAFPVTDCTRCHKYPNGHEIEKTATKRKVKPKKKKKKK